MGGEADPGRAELLGFFMSDHGLHFSSATFVPCGAGLTVFYGVNGSGKTRALEHVRDFWSGQGSSAGRGAMALVRLGPSGTVYGSGRYLVASDDKTDWAHDWAQFAALDAVAAARYGSSGKSTEAALEAWLYETIDFEPDDTPVTGRVESRRREALIEEWYAQRLAVILPTGSSQEPRWASAPALVTSSSTPNVNWAAELWERCSGADDFDDWHVLGMTPVGRLDEATVMAAGTHARVFAEEPWYYPTHQALLPLKVELSTLDDDLDGRTQRALQRKLSGDEVRVEGDQVLPSEALLEQRDFLQERANAHFKGMLLDAPRLHLDVRVAGLSGGVWWHVKERNPALDALSTAQRRWAVWAINEAVHELESTIELGDRRFVDGWEPPDPEVTRLFVIDEPEQALHRAAESGMAKRIANLAVGEDRCFLIATHSPELLDSQIARLVEVQRGPQGYALSPLDRIDRAAMARLGLAPSDLLRRQRGFLLVEGQHDVDVLEILLGDALRRLRVEVLPLRGATELSAPKARFLFENTRAHVFIMLDNLDTAEVAGSWDVVKATYLADGLDAARKQLSERFSSKTFGKGIEIRALSEFLSAALDQGTWNRVTPFGLSKGDVIEYLPVRQLVPGKKSWEQLRAAFFAEQAAGDRRDFKSWLSSRKADLSDHAVREALRTMDWLPKDFALLLKTLEAHTLDLDA